MRHPFTVKYRKDHKENYVQHQYALMIIIFKNKKEELTGKIKIQCAITSFFPEY